MTAKQQMDQGNLTGREKLFHGTAKENVDSILREGILKEKANDPNAFARLGLSKIKKVTPDQLNDKVYMSKNPYISAIVNEARSKRLGKDTPSEILEGRVPAWKMKTGENPELFGSKNFKEYYDEVSKAKEPFSKAEYKANYTFVGPHGTKVFEENIPPEYLKKSPLYQKISAGEVRDFITHNKGRFGTGVGAVVGAGAIGAVGAEAIRRYQKKN